MAEPETLPLVLRYHGPDVDDGTMSIEDIVPVLQGFSAAYSKVAAEGGASVQHRIRIVGVEKSSANILLQVWQTLGEVSGQLTSIQILASSAAAIVGTIFGVIKIKRHLRGEPYREQITSTNTVTITNSVNVSIEMPVHVFTVYKEKLIDSDIGRMVRPLEKGKIDEAEFRALPAKADPIIETVTADERQFFDTEQHILATTEPTWVVGNLNSLTKTTNSGFMYLSNGQRVFYHYAGATPQKLHAVFAHPGPVRVLAVAYLNESLTPERLDIQEIQPMQGHLFGAAGKDDAEG